MKSFGTIINSLQITIFILSLLIFILSLLFLLFIYAFKDTEGPLPLMFRIFTWAVLTYPIVFLIAWLLSRFVNHNLIYIACINLLITFSIMAWFIGGALFASYIVLPKDNRNKNTEAMQSASRDFTCDDGTFFSISRNDMVYYYGLTTIKHPEKFYVPENDMIYYYGLTIIKHPEKFYVPEIGFIKDGKSNIDIRPYQEKAMDQVKQKLNICKNKDGKTLLEVYPSAK